MFISSVEVDRARVAPAGRSHSKEDIILFIRFFFASFFSPYDRELRDMVHSVLVLRV